MSNPNDLYGTLLGQQFGAGLGSSGIGNEYRSQWQQLSQNFRWNLKPKLKAPESEDGIVLTAAAPSKGSAVEWLDKRVDEMRVKL